MDLRTELDRLEALLVEDDPRPAQHLISDLFATLREAAPSVREAALEEIAGRVGHEDPHVGAWLALIGGGLLEAGAPAKTLALAVREPLERALGEAAFFLGLARRFAELAALTPEAAPDPDAIQLGDFAIPTSAIDSIARSHWLAVRSFFSLATWYRPVVAAWSRDVGTLRTAKADAELRAKVAALGGASEGTHWLGLLLSTLFDAPMVVLFPESRVGYRLIVNGVVDVGQLSVLLSAPLAEAFARVEASGPASEAMLAVMRGEGAQKVEATYTASFHFYPWQALNPASMMPEDHRFEWSAPGGVGDHSLPPDFLPDALVPLRGARVVLAVGPNAKTGVHFSRVIPGTRTFESLRADVKNVERLSESDAAKWLDAVRLAVSS